MYIDYWYWRLQNVVTSYEIWCTNPTQLISRHDTEEEANKELLHYLECGTLYDDYLGRKFEAENFIIIRPGENKLDYDFIYKH